MAIAGKNSSFWVGNPLAKVAEGNEISVSVNGKTIDTTNFDSGEWEEYINGTKSYSITLNANFKATDAAQVEVMSNILNSGQSAYNWEYRLTSGATPKFSGSGITESFSVSSPVSDKITLSATIKGSGALVFSAS